MDLVHKHVVGHSTYKDNQVLLQRNKICNEECAHYLSEKIERYDKCRVVSQLSGNHSVRLHAPSRQFNDLVNVDHFHLDDDVFMVMCRM